MTTQQTAKNILKIAKAVRKEFIKFMPETCSIVTIDWSLPTVAILLPHEQEHFFQGEEASNLLAEAVETSNKFNVGVEDVLIWVSQSW